MNGFSLCKVRFTLSLLANCVEIDKCLSGEVSFLFVDPHLDIDSHYIVAPWSSYDKKNLEEIHDYSGECIERYMSIWKRITSAISSQTVKRVLKTFPLNYGTW